VEERPEWAEDIMQCLRIALGEKRKEETKRHIGSPDIQYPYAG